MQWMKENWGKVLASALWLALFVAAAALFHKKGFMQSTLGYGELGDIVAGAAAPLAFFWLVAGYFQNSRALKIQSESLKLQTEELRHSVKEMQRQNTTSAEHELNIHRQVFLDVFKTTAEVIFSGAFPCELFSDARLNYTGKRGEKVAHNCINQFLIEAAQRLSIKSELLKGDHPEVIVFLQDAISLHKWLSVAGEELDNKIRGVRNCPDFSFYVTFVNNAALTPFIEAAKKAVAP
jgi:hypothetical protein